MKLSDLSKALKLQAQLQKAKGKRDAVGSAVSLTMGSVQLSTGEPADFVVPPEKIAGIRNAILAAIDGEIDTAKNSLANLGVQDDGLP